MKGQLNEQDLTNYALNDGLEDRERLYVESMLGANEESRGDVYKMLELAQLLERGFAAEADRTVPRLTRDQRHQLLTAPAPSILLPFVRKTAAALSLAACLAFVVSNPSSWQVPGQTRTMAAAVSTEVSRLVNDAVTTESDEDDYTMWVSPLPLTEDDSSYIQTSGDMPPQLEEVVYSTEESGEGE